MAIEHIHLSQQAKDQLLRLKRATGLPTWNALCRWALCASLAESGAPAPKKIPADSNVEMSWRVFAGNDGDVFLTLVRERCVRDELATDPDTLAEQFRLHLHRGIAYLAANKRITGIDGLVSLALDRNHSFVRPPGHRLNRDDPMPPAERVLPGGDMSTTGQTRLPLQRADGDSRRPAPVTAEAGPLSDPSAPRSLARRAESPAVDEVSPVPPNAAPRRSQADPDVPGLRYVPDFISAEEEERLTEKIDGCEWRADLKRNVQHYGWRYDYTARHVDSSMRLGPLPDWADSIGRRLVAEAFLSAPPDQLIVNEYKEDQGISRHVDSPGFADGIVTISLLESWEMVFRQLGAPKRKVSKRLERRSAMILTGAARYDWTHEIPARKTEYDPSSGKRLKRKRRVSLTFRRVIVAEHDTTAGRRTPTNDRIRSGADLPDRRSHR